MDIAMPQLNGINAAEQILRRSPATRIIISSMYPDEELLTRALTVGVSGYLLKDSAETDLVRAVRAVRAGKSFFSPSIVQTLAEDHIRQLQSKGLQDSYDLLTTREGDSAVAGRREIEQGGRRPSLHQPLHRGDTPVASHAKAGSAQHG